MANIKSSKKRIRVAARKTLSNKHRRSTLRTAIKKADQALDAGAPDQGDMVRNAVAFIDKAALKGIIHKNTAARYKSRLVLRLNRAS